MKNNYSKYRKFHKKKRDQSCMGIEVKCNFLKTHSAQIFYIGKNITFGLHKSVLNYILHNLHNTFTVFFVFVLFQDGNSL